MFVMHVFSIFCTTTKPQALLLMGLFLNLFWIFLLFLMVFSHQQMLVLQKSCLGCAFFKAAQNCFLKYWLTIDYAFFYQSHILWNWLTMLFIFLILSLLWQCTSSFIVAYEAKLCTKYTRVVFQNSLQYRGMAKPLYIGAGSQNSSGWLVWAGINLGEILV